MGNKYLKISEFTIEGKFLGFLQAKRQKNKYLQLKIESGNVEIKLPKELRPVVSQSLVPGSEIRVLGVSKLHSQTGKIKLKAHDISAIDEVKNQENVVHNKAKILVCQKSSCRKRGGQGLISEIEKTLCDRGLEELVEIEKTGCLKRCHSAPSCVFQVGKKQYKKMHPEAIVNLLMKENAANLAQKKGDCSRTNIA